MDPTLTNTSGETEPRTADPAPVLQEPDHGFFPAEDSEGSAEAPLPSWAIEKRYGFRLGNLAFLLKPNTRAEAVPEPAISPIPHSPRWLLGVLNLRGNLVPVFDFGQLCGIQQDQTPSRKSVLVLDAGEKAVGFPIDALPVSVSNFEVYDRPPPMADILTDSLGDCFTTDTEVWVEFDHEAFFSTLQYKMTAAESSQAGTTADDAQGVEPV